MNININNSQINNEQAVPVRDKISSAIKNAILAANLSQGDVFRGEIQDILGNNVKILLEGGEFFQATMENGVDFNIGENVEFLVKSNQGNKLILQSIAEKLPFTETALKALEALGITPTEENVQMVKEMMSYNMPMDSKSLGDMERLVNIHRDTDIPTLVAMKNHNIPISDENINQFQAYKSYEHKITEGINKVFDEVIKFAQVSGDNKLTSDLSNILLEHNMVEVNTRTYTPDGQSLQPIVSEQAVAGNISAAVLDGGNPAINNVSIPGADPVPMENPVSQEVGSKQAAVMPQEQAVEKNLLPNEQSIINQEKPLLKQVAENLRERWLLNPKELTENKPEEIKTAIKNNYESIVKTLDKLMEALRDNGMEKTNLYKSAENLKSNISFMNDVNQMASYVQIPFKTFNGEGNGELYVYNKNKNKSVEDGKITAFLHLDMENLGATDVKVVLENSNITTKFTLEDEESQRIVEENLPWLKARLEKLGYTAELTVDMVCTNIKPSPFEDILQMDKPKRQIKRYSFDIRL